MCWQVQYGVPLPAVREAGPVRAAAVLGDADASTTREDA